MKIIEKQLNLMACLPKIPESRHDINFLNLLGIRFILIINLLFLFGGLNRAFSQKEASIWYFGNKAGVKFHKDSVSALIDGEMVAEEGCASIADKQGKLLFYTNGISVWNRQHKLMPNGQGLLGNISSTQSTLIIPKPGSETIYYICTVDGITGNSDLGAFFSELDMNLDNSLGDITVNKNIPLVSPTDEKMTAVKHENGRDIWLLIAERLSSRLHAYLVTSTGINTASVISNFDTIINSVNGYMKCSPNGKKIVLPIDNRGKILIGDFDPMTGKVKQSSHFTLNPFSGSVYGVEFSPSGRYLYISAGFQSIVQFNIEKENIDFIAASGFQVLNDHYIKPGALQLATDGRIYFSEGHKKYLGVIKKPNVYGPDCDVDVEAVYLKRGAAKLGLPNFIQSYFTRSFGYQPGSLCLPQFSFFINDTAYVKNVLWDFGDTASGKENNSKELFPTHVFSKPGDYKVRLIVEENSGQVDTIIYTVQAHTISANFFVADSVTYCLGDTVILDAYLDNASYLWNTGDKTSRLSIMQTGVYTVNITLDSCIITDTFYITFFPKPTVYIGSDTTFCGLPDHILKPVTNGSYFKWNTGDTTKDLYVNKEGMYSLLVKSAEMCENADTVNIRKIEYPFASLQDTSVCGDYAILDAGNLGSTYLWSTGEQSRTIKIKEAGIYTLAVNNGLCSISDTIEITFIPEEDCLPILFIPNSFSPNGDGLNDIFKVEAINISSFQLEIYNRWGEKIFTTTNPNSGWTGMYKHEPVPIDVYFYLLRYSYAENQYYRKVNKNGTIQLLR